jgi:Mg-chelatase subunit ChlD
MKQFYTLLFSLLTFFSLAAGMRARGVIRDMDTNAPVKDAVVTITFDTGYDLSDTTDASGQYEISTPLQLREGDYGIRISARNYYSVYGFIKIKQDSYNEHKMKKQSVKDTLPVVIKSETVKPVLEGYANNNLVFLIDISSSMNAPEKLPLLKESLKYLVEQLRPSDKIAILTFSNYAKEVLPSTRVADKVLIQKTIDGLTFGSTSQGGAALGAAYKTAINNFVQKGNNRIILASDGIFTSGEKDYQKMQEQIEQGLDKNIVLSVFCYGKNTPYVTGKLKKLTSSGHGNFATITSLEDGKMYMIEEAKAVKN